MPSDSFERSLGHHLDWVRALARELVVDDARADDVVQAVCLAALRKRPHVARLRRWLRGAVRIEATQTRRADANRSRRERVAARAEAVPATDELVERAATARRIVEHVVKLPEPMRRAILLRYFDERTPREIARIEGAPVETIKTRLKRGLSRLRADLAEDHGGDRRAMLGALVAVASVRVPSATTASSALVASAVGVAAAAAVVAAVALGPTRPEPAEPPGETRPTTTHAAPVREAIPAPRESTRVAERSASTVPPRAVANAGVVRDRDGAPIVGARVRAIRVPDGDAGRGGPVAISEPVVLASARTDAAGRYALGALPTARWWLDVVASGHAARRGPPPHGDVVLAPGGRLVGRVVDGAGVPIADATVVAHGTEPVRVDALSLAPGAALHGDVGRVGVAEVRTDRDGRFAFVGLAAGDHTLSVFPADAPAFHDRAAHAVAAGETSRVAIVAPRLPTMRVAGVVVDAGGRPVAGAVVRCAGNDRRRARTAADGRFAFARLPLGGDALLVVHPDHEPTRVPVGVTAPDDVSLVVRLGPRGERSADVVGHGAVVGVFDATAPVDAALALEPVDAGRPSTPWVRPDAGGRFAFARVAAGRYRFVGRIVDPAGRVRMHPFRAVVDVVPSATVDARVAFDAGATIGGRVVDETGAPRAGTHVLVRADDGAGRFGWTRTDDDGRFAFAGLARDVRHDVFVRGHGTHFDVRRSAVSVGDVALAITLDARTAIRGVVRAADGAPVESFWVRAYPHVGPQRPHVSVHARTDGTFDLGRHPLPSGVYDIEAGDAAGRVSNRVRGVRIAPRAPARRLAFVLGTGGSIRGHAPVGATRVQVVRADGGVERRFAPVAADGSFRVAWLRPGRYRVRAEAPDRIGAPVDVVVPVGGASVAAPTFVGCGAIDVVARGGARVTLDAPMLDGFSRPPSRDRPIETGADGRVRIVGVPPGAYHVWLTHPAARTVCVAVRVAGGVATATAPMPPAGRLVLRVRDARGAPVVAARATIVDEAGDVVAFDARALAARHRAARAANPGLTRARLADAIDRTDRAGAFVRGSLAPGRYRVRLTDRNGTTRERPFAIEAGRDTRIDWTDWPGGS